MRPPTSVLAATAAVAARSGWRGWPPGSLITLSYQRTASIDRIIAHVQGNQALAFRLSCVKSLIYGVRSRVEASIHDCACRISGS